MKSTPEMRARARELAANCGDDFDRAIIAILDDFDSARAAGFAEGLAAGAQYAAEVAEQATFDYADHP